MSDPRDNDLSGVSSAGAAPRKPRIEVLGPAEAAAKEASIAPERPSDAGPSPERRRGGLVRSPTMLLMLLAAIAIAGLLLYTYLSSERDAEYGERGPELSPADAELLGTPEVDGEAPGTREAGEPDAAAGIDDGAAPEPELTASPAPLPAQPRPSSDEARPAEVAARPEEPPTDRSEPADDDAGASDTVRAFYSALSAGDGGSAAQLVVPQKRQSGPLSAGALSRYYSSFRRPLRLRSLSAVDADTVRVAYDYVLADGRVCRGQAVVDVVQRGGRSLVGAIRTRGPC